MNHEVYDIGQKLYTVANRRQTISTDLRESIGEDANIYGPVIEEEEVRSITVKVSQTVAHDGSMTRKEERWHRLSSGSMVGPANLIKRSFLTLEEAQAKATTEYEDELASARAELVIAQAKISFYEEKLSSGNFEIRASDED